MAEPATVEELEQRIRDAQDKFNVEIPDEAVTELKTVQDAVSYITKAQNDAAAV